MAELLTRLRTQVVDWFTNTEPRKKWLTIGGLATLILTVAILMFVMTRTQYAVLYRGISTEEAAQVSAKLDELGIRYQVKDNASSIFVDENAIDKARMELSVAGLISDSGFSYEDVISQLNFTQTTEEKNRLFLLAQQNEIAQALKNLDGVEDARVILNVKATSSFLNLEEDVSSASVTLRLKPNRTVNEQQINGMVNFITTSVKGLTPEKVTIIDQTGKQLNRTGDDTDVGTSSTQDELKVAVENRLDKNIAEFLAQMYGPDNVQVKSSVKLDFDKQVTDVVQFTTPVEGATEGLVRSMNTIKENVVNNASGGVAGTDTNTAEVPNFPTGSSGQSDYSKSQEILNYELNELRQTITKAEGQIVDVSFSVIINKKALVDETLTEEHKQEVINLVSAASGLENTKNVVVVAKDFYEAPEVPLGEQPATLFNIPIWVYFVILGMVALTAGIVFLMIRRKASSLKVAQEIIEEQEELEEINTDFQDKSSPKYQIEKFVDSRPEAVAQLLRSWLNED